MISVSTSKSGSNWLDRLRSSRGFPTGAEPDLDRFLASSSSSATTFPAPSTHSESIQSFRRGESSGASLPGGFSDLFSMGECSRSFSKQHRNGRKQSNPRCFNGGGRNTATVKSVDTSNNGNELCSSDDLRREKSENAVASSGDNSLNDKNANNNSNNSNGNHVHNSINNANNSCKCGDDDADKDLKGYTRNEVTVIDTSCKEWKSDKWVFRKKESDDEWKIKDKKSCFRGGRKRKCVDNDNHEMEMKKNMDDIHGKEKKKKKKKILLLNEVQPRNEPSNIVIGKVPHSRFPCPRPPEKPRPESSPVILLKSIPPSNNTNVVTKLAKGIHKKKPNKMKII